MVSIPTTLQLPFAINLFILFALHGDYHASTIPSQGGINAKDYNGKKAREGLSERRGQADGTVGSGAGAVLAGVACGVTAREVPRESVRCEFYRCCRKSAAEGNSPAGRTVARRRLSESSHRAGNRRKRKERREHKCKGTAQALAHHFLHIIFRFDAGIQRGTRARHKQAERHAREYAWAGPAAHPGPSRWAGAEAKYRCANRDSASGPERARQKYFSSGLAAAGEREHFGRSAESKPARTVRRQDAIPRISEDAGTLSGVLRGPDLRHASFRPVAVAPLSSGARHSERQQGQQSFDTRTSHSVGRFAVHRDAARDGKRGGITVARKSGTGTV